MIDWPTLRSYALTKTEAYETTPFGPDTAVFKVAGKIFALVPWTNDPLTVSLKCDPYEATAFRSTYPAVRPGWHLNKRHWNTVTVDGSLPDELVLEMVDESYALVVEGLPKTVRLALKERNR